MFTTVAAHRRIAAPRDLPRRIAQQTTEGP
jgi:hypothetical protein